MRRLTLIIPILTLAACSHPGTPYGRDWGETDAHCMRRVMSAPNARGQFSFDMAAGVCGRVENLATHSVFTAKSLPLDLRSDPELQQMAEDPDINVKHRPFVPRTSTQPLQKWPVFSNQGVVQ